MSYSTFSGRLFQLTTLSLALALAGCGDGFKDLGPRPELGSVDNGNGAGTGTTSPSTGGTGTSVGQNIFLEGDLLNAQGSSVRNINVDGATYKVRVLDKNKQPIVGALVNFSVNSTGITLKQNTSGAFLTNNNGEASVFLKPDNIEVSGAYIISATASLVGVNGSSQSIQQAFSVQADDVVLGDITAERSSLLSGEETVIHLNVSNKQGDKASGIIVDLSASCGLIQTQATSNPEGLVSAVYKSVGDNGKACSGDVLISARKGSQAKDTKITIAQPTPTTVLYTTQGLQVLGLGDSGTTSTSQVEFTVYNNKQPLANQKVVLSLTQTPEGFSFGRKGNTKDLPLTSDSEGKVRVNLYPGSTPGPIEIKATIDENGNGAVDTDEMIFALSKDLAVGGGRTTQSGISIGFERNVLDWSVNGESSTVTARLRDRNSNPVPEGTVVSFTAEGGKIEPSCKTDKDGNCSVNFYTQNFPYDDHRVSVLAVVEGEKDFIDKNQNNAWDANEPFVHNIGDTFRDDNENGMRDRGELIYPLRANGRNTCENSMIEKFSSKASQQRYKFKWVMPNIDDTCTNELVAPVRSQVIALLSNSRLPKVLLGKPTKDSQKDGKINYTFTDGTVKNVDIANVFAKGFDFSVAPIINANDKQVAFLVNSNSFGLNPMPSGTTFDVVAEDETPDNKKECKVKSFGDGGVPNVVNGSKDDNLGTVTGVNILNCAAGDTITLKIAPPNVSKPYEFHYVIQ